MELQKCLEYTKDVVDVGLVEQIPGQIEEEETRKEESVKQIQRNRERKVCVILNIDSLRKVF